MEGLAHIARPVPQGEALERVSLILGLARQVTLESAASMHKARRVEVMSREVVEGVFIAASLLVHHVAETNGHIVSKVAKREERRLLRFIVLGKVLGRTVKRLLQRSHR